MKKIKRDFPEIKVLKSEWDNFEIVVKIRPTSISELYEVKIVYTENKWIKIFVVNKVLKTATNRTKLPHVYDSHKQQLCLYSPSKKEWNAHNYIIDTILPWISEWLYFYELWLPEGKWLGGGHNEYPNEDNTDTLVNEE
ncbi:hypothetical protein [Xanthomarina gelatinilytica]|uniref:hypothetical protein n=1 Tax=Xanthomarina gelatinilytica TaxID=1137281 RepID=UPI003AA9C229